MSEDRIDKIIMLLGEIKSDVKHNITALHEHTILDDQRFGKISDDLGDLEKRVAFRSGARQGITGVVGAASGIFATFITLWLKGWH